jgi:hypothetical protein
MGSARLVIVEDDVDIGNMMKIYFSLSFQREINHIALTILILFS